MSVIGGLLVTGLGGLLVIAGTRRLFTAVSLYRSDAVPLRNVTTEEGTVEFEGQVAPSVEEGTFEAPFSGEETVCCQVWMQTKDRHRTDIEGLEIGTQQMEPETYENTESALQLAESGEIRRSFGVEDGGARVAVDPDGADLDITEHMGKTVLTVDAGETLPEAVRDRLRTLELEAEFDGSVETWARENDRVAYREARLEPGTPVHVAGASVEHVPDEWGSATDATVSGSDTNGQFLISEGTESDVVRKHFVQFITGIIFGSGLLAVGLHILDIVTVL